MKDRVREAVFNLLGPAVRGKHAVDLFAGTGALGLEALSRGAARAAFIEQHHPTAEILRENIAALEVEADCDVVFGSVFLRGRWMPRLTDRPWLVFCSPPYAFYLERQEEMHGLLAALVEAAPEGSLLVAESDQRFALASWCDLGSWDVRQYPPAQVGILEKPESPR